MTRDIFFPKGTAELLDAYDGFVVDLWGVMHNGVQAFPEAVEVLKHLVAAKKRVVILSNAPRRVDQVVARNRELGIGDDLSHGVLSSGEITWRHLRDRRLPFYQKLGKKVFLLGPRRDNGMKEGLGLDLVESLAEADFILLTGVLEGLSSRGDVSAYDDLLQGALARGLPMVCANPDLVVVRGRQREICAGAIAERYEKLGGALQYHGKPFLEVYHEVMALMEIDDPKRIIAVGDSLRTDVTGANRAGMASLFIGGGIHYDQTGDLHEAQGRDSLRRLCRKHGVWPTAALPILFWS